MRERVRILGRPIVSCFNVPIHIQVCSNQTIHGMGSYSFLWFWENGREMGRGSYNEIVDMDGVPAECWEMHYESTDRPAPTGPADPAGQCCMV